MIIEDVAKGRIEERIGEYAQLLAIMFGNLSIYGTIFKEKLLSIEREMIFSEQIKDTLLAPYRNFLKSSPSQ